MSLEKRYIIESMIVLFSKSDWAAFHWCKSDTPNLKLMQSKIGKNYKVWTITLRKPSTPVWQLN